MRQIALIADETDVVRVLRARLDELGVSRRELDSEAGLTSSHSEKLLCLPQIKYFGAKSFWNIFESVGYAVLIVEDPAATARYAARMASRETNQVRRRSRALVLSGRIPWLITTSERAKELAMLAFGSMTPAARRARARKAATVRWDRVKAAAKGMS